MQTYRLVIGPDGNVHIPDGEPGQLVTVLVDEASRTLPTTRLKPVSAMTREEQARLKEEFLERGRQVRAQLKDQEPIEHGSELYGDDGLPR